MAARIQISSLAKGTVQSTLGPAVFNASVAVFQANTTNPVTVFAAPTGGGTIPQPLRTDHEGDCPGWLTAQQIVDISVNGGPIIQVNVATGTPALADLTDGVAILNAIAAIAFVNMLPTAVKTTNYNAVAQDYVPVDTTGGAVTITLPTAPANGTMIGVKMVVQGGTNAVTVAAGGSDVFNKAGGSTSVPLTVALQGIVLRYALAAHIWYIEAADVPMSYLDTALIPTAVKTANYTAVANDLVVADMSGSAWAITLPTAPADKTRLAAKIVTTGNTLTINAAGAAVFNKAGGVTSLTLARGGSEVILEYSATPAIWYVINSSVGDENEFAFSTWRNVEGQTLVESVPGGQAAGTYLFIAATGLVAVSGAGSGGAAFWFDPADYAAGSRTVKVRVRGMVLTNAVAPACNFTIGMYPVSTWGGASGAYSTITALGAATASVAINTPALTTQTHSESSVVTAPTAGWYVLAVVTSGSAAANSDTTLQARLQVQQV